MGFEVQAKQKKGKKNDWKEDGGKGDKEEESQDDMSPKFQA